MSEYHGSLGALNLPYNEVGQVAQALGRAVVQRGTENIGEAEVIAYLTSDSYSEDDLWDQIGPIVDRLEDRIRDFTAVEDAQPSRRERAAALILAGKLLTDTEIDGILDAHGDVRPPGYTREEWERVSGRG